MVIGLFGAPTPVLTGALLFLRYDGSMAWMDTDEYREIVRARDRARYARESARRKAASRACYAEKGSEIRAQENARYHANPEPNKAAARKWREKNPEKYQAVQRAHQARRRQAVRDGDFTGQDWLDLLEEFDSACAYCQARGIKLEVEHMTPLSRGGRHTKGNIVPACETCNDRKYTRTLFEFAALARPDRRI